MESLTRSLDGVVVAAPGQLTRSPVSGSIVVHADNPRATLAQLQRLGVPLPPAVSAMDASVIAAEGTLAGSLGDAAIDSSESASTGCALGS